MAVDKVRDAETRKLEQIEVEEWLSSLEYIVHKQGKDVAARVLRHVYARAAEHGVVLSFEGHAPYLNTISKDEEPLFPGNIEIERRIKSLIRWNAMAMVVAANRSTRGIGGHISTYASAATLYEVGFNHFFKGRGAEEGADQIYFQGHAAPGIYARAFLEGRIEEDVLCNFRRELPRDGGLGLTSYPHPRGMPNFWEFPTVSMGLGLILAVYQARFNRYLEDRKLLDRSGRVWCFVGDGEMDEPESLGGLALAGREKLDNLTVVVNCNLQRLDGPVRGNHKIIQELETLFHGAGWKVIKVVWGGDWDPLFARDVDGVLTQRLAEAVDGDFQKYSVESGAYIREHFFGTDPRLKQLVEHLTDDALQRLKRGGHDPVKVHAAYLRAVTHKGNPTVILAHTIKGYGLGDAGEGRNITHQQKKLNEEELREFRSRFGIPISDEQIDSVAFYKPPASSPEIRYLKERREALGGFVPSRVVSDFSRARLDPGLFDEFTSGSHDREISTTTAFVRMLAKLLKDKGLGPRVVPIVPDEARTFGMEALFRQVGIYSHTGQLYEPVDRDTLLYYREDPQGQVLEEGITEAGAMSSFIAAGTAYATHAIPFLPFFVFYSMFGFQRIGDLIWAAGDMQARGFLIGGTAGRTTLAGEGLQHQDGQSHLLAYPSPHIVAYDPAFAYELAVILESGVQRMYRDGENVIFYVTVGNETYPMPPMPDGCKEGILKGMYRVAEASVESERKAQILGSGTILREALRAKEILEREFLVATDVWSVTSYKNLHRDGLDKERYHRLHPAEPKSYPYVTNQLEAHPGVVVAASDYVKALPASIAKWVPRRLFALGTDGFGRSEDRERLRDYFEVSAEHITAAALVGLVEDGLMTGEEVRDAIAMLGIDPEKPDPFWWDTGNGADSC